jgi:hypothetical protein
LLGFLPTTLKTRPNSSPNEFLFCFLIYYLNQCSPE